MKTIATITAVVLALAALPAGAQDKGDFGLNATFDGAPSIGATWHLGGRLALRPMFSFGHSTMEGDSSIGPEGRPGATSSVERDETRYGVGLGLLYFLKRKEGLAPYFGVSYQRGHASSNTGGTAASPGNVAAPGDVRPPVAPPLSADAKIEREESGNTLRAFFGAHHAFSSRLSVYGDFGLVYFWGQSEVTGESDSGAAPGRREPMTFVGTSSLEPKAFGSFSASVGVIFYLN